jgi:hypothetical protein
MKALIIVESMFGNTRTIADHIATSLRRRRMSVEVYDVEAAPRSIPDDVDLLVVGGPTHAFGLSRSRTRADAVSRGAPTPADTGLRDWLDAPPDIRGRPGIAVFDTRIQKPLLPGSAARSAFRKLRRSGWRLLVKPTSFYVEDVAGPLRTGEEARAERWAEDVMAALSPQSGESGRSAPAAG